MNKAPQKKKAWIRPICYLLILLTLTGASYSAIMAVSVSVGATDPLADYRFRTDNTYDIYISCGVIYGDGALDSVKATSGTGFVIGEANITTGNRSFTPLFMLESATSVCISPLTFLQLKGDKYLPCDRDQATILPFRIELSSTSSDVWTMKEEIETAIPAAKDMFSVRALVNGEKYLRYGAFPDAVTASAAAGEFEALLSGKNVSVNISIPTGTGTCVIDNASGNVIFEFDSSLKSSMPAIFPIKGSDGSTGSTALPDGYVYYDPLCFSRQGDKFNVINLVELNTYVQGVLPSEIYASWPMEVQKAFAIIVRSYSICSIGGRHFAAYNFDICNTTCCQVYHGRFRVNDNVVNAVNETGYKVITSGGRAVSAAYYSAIHGGESSNASYVWGGSNPSHIIAQKTPWEEYTKYPQNHGYWTAEFTPSALTLQLRSKGYTNLSGPITELTVNSRAGTSNLVYYTTYKDSKGNTQSVSRTSKNYAALGVYSANYDIAFNSVDYYLDTVISVDIKRMTDATSNPLISKFHVLTSGGLFQSNSASANVITASGIFSLPQSTLSALTANGSVELEQLKFGASDPDENGYYTAVNVYKDTVITTVLKREYHTFKASAPGNIVIAGKGWGHNLGMSQYGARDLAVFGAEYDQIIHAYFAGVEIISLK